MSQSLARSVRRQRELEQRKLDRKAQRKGAPPPALPTMVKTEPGKTVPVSVVMIVKDCAASLQKTLESLRSNFLRPTDELLLVDTGSVERDTLAVASLFGARVIERPDLAVDFRPYVEKWLPDFLEAFDKSSLADGCIIDFAAARQVAADAAKNDVQFWIDSDDILQEKNPGQVRAMIDQIFTSDKADAMFMEYVYSTDERDGLTTTTLKRERAYDRRAYRWVGRCHETAIPPDGVPVRGAAFFQDLPSAIVHIKERTPFPNSSDIRNYIILRKEIEDCKAAGKGLDPRTLFYLGNAARGLKLHGEAVQIYRDFIPVSGSRDDRYAAEYYIGVMFLHESVKRPVDAIDSFLRCLKLKPEDPRTPFGLARAYFLLGKYAEARHWFKVGRMLPEPKESLHSYDPTHISALPLQIEALSCEKQGDEEGAAQAVDALIQARPNHPETETLKKYIGNWIAGRRLVDSVRRVVANSKTDNPHARVEIGQQVIANMAAVPPELEDLGLAKLACPDPRTEGRPLTIFCGKAIEAWGPQSGAAGIGGSEKAVIQMAPRLQKRGFRVTVYANVPAGQRGVDPATGVRWEHFGAMHRNNPVGILIGWRSPAMLEMAVPAEKRILWCHDVQRPEEWTAPRVALANEVWVLSEFHATTLGPARARLGDKVVITRNGIDAALYRKHFGCTRNEKKVVFASSPDRGVKSAIDLFQAADVAGSELHVFYGFNKMYLDSAAACEYRHIPDIQRDGSLYDYMQTVLTMADKDDRIHWRGRVGWEELAQEMCSAGAWLYPCKFPEISCMAAMEAQAAGLIPVCNDFAALAETVPLGVRQQPNPETLRMVLQGWDPQYRLDLHNNACDRFDYEALADEWAQRLK